MRATLLSALSVAVAPAVDYEDRVRGAMLGSLVADALCLGSHYEYDAKVIKQAYGGTIQEYMAPGEKMGGTTHGVGWGRRNYHPGQKKGDQTDYGEYNVLVLEHLSKHPGQIKLDEFVPTWRKRLESPTWGAWKCTQTRQALQKVQAGSRDYSRLGGHSNAMAMRSAGVFGVLSSEEEVAQAARLAMFTHASSEALTGGEYFTRVAWRVIHKQASLREAIDGAATAMNNPWITQQVKKGIAKYEEVIDPSRPLGKEEFADDLAMTSMARLWNAGTFQEGGRTEPIKVGKASPTEGTLPSSVYIILRYQDDFAAAVKANAMVGGDSASRAVAIGMVMGAYHGLSSIPKELITTLNAAKKVNKMLNGLPLLRGPNREL